MGARYSRSKNEEDDAENKSRRNFLTSIKRTSIPRNEREVVPTTHCSPGPFPPELTDRQREILVESFGNLKEKISQVGVLLFIGLFESHPEIQGFFGILKDCPPEDWPNSKQLRQHALRVMGFLEKCIARINTPERLDALIKELGSHHVRYGAPLEYISFVGPQFICAIRLSLETQWSEETEKAWLDMFMYIAYGMKHAIVNSSSNMP